MRLLIGIKSRLEQQFLAEMIDPIHKTLMRKTIRSLDTLKMLTQMLNQLKTRVPSELLTEALTAKEHELRADLQSKGITVDKKLEQILVAMKGTNFDLVKSIDKSKKSLQEYYKNQPTQEQEPPQCSVREKAPSNIKTKTIKKVAKGSRPTPKKNAQKNQEIFEESSDQFCPIE